jgi:hypothetical protein
MTVVTQGLVTYPQDAQLQQEFSCLQQAGVRPALKMA